MIDLVLQDTDGYELIRSMRDDGNDVPVVIMSGLTQPEATVRGSVPARMISSPSRSTRMNFWLAFTPWCGALAALPANQFCVLAP